MRSSRTIRCSVFRAADEPFKIGQRQAQCPLLVRWRDCRLGSGPGSIAGRRKTSRRSTRHVPRYVAHFPTAGEIILFDRSWYNRAGVERVMGFCSNEQYERLLALVRAEERAFANASITLRGVKLGNGPYSGADIAPTHWRRSGMAMSGPYRSSSLSIR